MKAYLKYVIFISLLINLINSAEYDPPEKQTELLTENQNIDSTAPSTEIQNVDSTAPSTEIQNIDSTELSNEIQNIDSTEIQTEKTSTLKNNITGDDSPDYVGYENNQETTNNNYSEIRCLQTEPTKDIVEDCYDEKLSSGRICCYMEIKFKYNSYYGCIPLDPKEVKKEIKNKKNEYDVKSLKINCNSFFISFKLLFLLLIYL